MRKPIHLTKNDTGMTLSGSITQLAIGQLQNSDLASCAVKFSLMREGVGAPVVFEAAATLGALNAPNNSIDVSYRLQAADVATPINDGYIRWTFILMDGGKIHAPGDPDQWTRVIIHP